MKDDCFKSRYDDTPVSVTRQGPFTGRAGENYELYAHSTWNDGLTRPTSRMSMYILTLSVFGNGRQEKRRRKRSMPKSRQTTASVQSLYFCVCLSIAFISNSVHGKSGQSNTEYRFESSSPCIYLTEHRGRCNSYSLRGFVQVKRVVITQGGHKSSIVTTAIRIALVLTRHI